MSRSLAVTVAAVAALVAPAPAAAHFIQPAKSVEKMRPQQRVAYFDRVHDHARYVALEGRGKPKRSHAQLARWARRELAEARARMVWTLPPKAAICAVFGSYCSQALRVAGCETGWTYWVGASNGQYQGLFQMGSWERSTYGHSSTAYGQALAAWRYFVASGKDWSPWECKP